MGQSTDAIFGFGWVGDEEFYIDLPPNEDGTELEGDQREEERTNVFEAARESCEEMGVVLDTHCSGECQMPYLACADSKVTQRHWRSPVEISNVDMQRLTSDKMQRVMVKKLRAAVDMLHKEFPSVAEALKLPTAIDVEFVWFLCSDWN